MQENGAKAERIVVRGLVQGVGFRPFVWRLARRLGIEGDVSNVGDAVLIRAAAPPEVLGAFAAALTEEAPPLARVEAVERAPLPAFHGEGFAIAASAPGTVSAGVVPDIATCPACRTEIRDPAARRHRYAFTNCTDCGPRFSIVEGLPYDRATTTMRGFRLCPDCQGEYEDPADRRFHAQPIACPACGPRLTLEIGGTPASGDPLAEAAERLKAGAILAIKGIGGFHIACDATNETAVAELRRRKHRPTKPLALMVRDRAMLEELCAMEPAEWEALCRPSAPILLLRRHEGAMLAPSLAPGNARLGVMLPYTPLHHLLMEAVGRPLVLTSANRSGEPQIYRDAEVREGLAGIIDGVLTHDRPIARRLDDSVARLAAGAVRVMRRGRGLAPAPRALPPGFAPAPAVLALGGELKSAICLSTAGRALLSHHLGDLDELATQDAFETAIADYTALFDHRPAAIAVDLHPDYRASRLGAALAAARGLPLIGVQHHHAHIAAAMAEHGWTVDAGPVIGLALDGLGLGEDGTAWGAEILLCDYTQSRRLARLTPIALAGGDVASREPWRVLLAHLDAALPPEDVPTGLFDGLPAATVRAMIARGINAPPASSAGRLFDAMAALLGLAPHRLSFEGEAALALEALAAGAPPAEGVYAFDVVARQGLAEIDPAPMWRAAVADLRAGQPPAAIAARFHAGVARVFARAALTAAAEQGAGAIALSGGVMQNAVLLGHLVARLAPSGLALLVPAEVPANDGGLAFGQAAVAAARLMQR
ncbi:carbamoyltransferase HypF [Ancylobacter sp. VNQ12]|uniref:carbamoyltransferase HypF n=1 Tax=Ancylobacter sp. VNQ12 TaxID=3400920 RepID=UPI003C048054